MKKISTSLLEIIQNNEFLAFGLKNHLLNLSQTASYLKPFIEARTKKEVTESAILMGLSRLNREKIAKKSKKDIKKENPIINFSIRTNLTSLTYYNNSTFRSQLNDFYPDLRGHRGYFTQSQGINEYSIIIDSSLLYIIEKHIKERPKNKKENLISFNIQMKDEYYEEAGVIAKLLDKIAFQGINVYEISSTYAELIFYVDEKDMKLTVETLCSMNNGSK